MFKLSLVYLLIIFTSKFSNVQSAVNITFQAGSGIYIATTNDQVILDEDSMLPIVGEHVPGYGNSDVTLLLSGFSIIKVFPSLIIDEFVNLKDFLLNSVEMVSFGRPITNCQNLETFRLSFNEFSTIPGGIFRNCNKVQISVLSYNKITNFDNNAFEGLSGLRELHLSNNQVKIINPNIFGNLSSLILIDLEDNVIEELSPGIFGSSPLLDTLKLKGNIITTWNSSILENNRNLRYLGLSSNHLQSLDGYAFANLPNLQTLSLGRFLEEIPTFINLGQLETLDITTNEIKHVSAEPFRSLASLKFLFLRNNLIETVNLTMRADKFLTNLEYLSLRANRIATIQDNAFSMLEKLNELELSGNLIVQLNKNSIRPIAQLRTLNVGSNTIRKIERELFDEVSVLQFLSTGNICFDGELSINNTLNNDDYKNLIAPQLEQCFTASAYANELHLITVITSFLVTLIMKI